jgi:hypothetical protein
MEAVVRIGVSLTVMAGVTLGALLVDGPWLHARLDDLWNLPTNYVEARRAEERGLEIAADGQLLQERVERKRQIASAVLNGQLSLSAAADQFFQASKDAPYDWDWYRGTHPKCSLRVRCAMLVIDDVRQLVVDQENDPTAITTDLRRQMAAWQGE